MSEDVAQPLTGVDSEAVTETETTSADAEGISEQSTPAVEMREGRMYIDGVRVYTRDDTNKIAANARREVERSILSELGVEDLGQVREVISTLQESTSGNDLNVESLRETVKRREQTVEELKAELNTLKTEMTMSSHLSKLNSEMPSNWTPEQRGAVLDLMKTRGMFELQDGVFAIRHAGELMVDDSGEAPDYAAAVQLMGKTLGLPTTKQGLTAVESPREPGSEPNNKAIDDARLKSDAAYRAAYVTLRQNRNLSRDQITDSMVKKTMESVQHPGKAGMLYSTPTPQNSQTKSNRRK